MNRNVLVTIAVSLLLGSSIGIGIGYYILQPQIDSLNDEIIILNNEIIILNVEKNEIESQRIELANVNSDLDFQILDLNSDLQERLEDINKLEKNVAMKNNEIDSLEIRISEINAQKEELESNVAMMRNQVQELEINKEENEVEIAELNEEIRENLDRLVVIINESNSLIVELVQLNIEVNELKEELEMWKLWKEHRDLAPPNNPGYRYEGGWCTQAWIDVWGSCAIKYPAVIIPFENIDNCMAWTRFLGTGSMRPFIYKDTLGITIKADCLTESDISAGDMIAFNGSRIWQRTLGNGVMHQVIEVVSCSHDSSKTCYVTKGTHNDSIDGEVRFEEIIGKLILINF